MRRRAVVLQDVVVVHARDLAHGTAQTREHTADRRRALVAQLVQVRLGLFGDDERVPARQWPYIEERDDVVVFVDAMARDAASNDPAADRLRHDEMLAPT